MTTELTPRELKLIVSSLKQSLGIGSVNPDAQVERRALIAKLTA